jgi:hypothetical protein
MKKVLFLIALLNIYNVSFTNDINSTEVACLTECQQCEICLNKIASTVKESNDVLLQITE